jgi:hypothetical protein
MRLQLNYDLAQIERNAAKIVVNRVVKKSRKAGATSRSAA